YPHALWKEVLLSRHSSALRSATEVVDRLCSRPGLGHGRKRTAGGRHMVRSDGATGSFRVLRPRSGSVGFRTFGVMRVGPCGVMWITSEMSISRMHRRARSGLDHGDGIVV